MAVNESNNQEVLEGIFEYTLTSYLQNGESKESMLKKFNGDKTEAIIFLRERGYKEWIKNNKNPVDTSLIKNKIETIKKQREEDVLEGRLTLYNAPQNKENKINTITPTKTPSEKSKITPTKSEEQKVKVKKEEKPAVKYIEPDEPKRKWSTKKEKPKSDKNQQSFF